MGIWIEESVEVQDRMGAALGRELNTLRRLSGCIPVASNDDRIFFVVYVWSRVVRKTLV